MVCSSCSAEKGKKIVLLNVFTKEIIFDPDSKSIFKFKRGLRSAFGQCVEAFNSK
jgi:hypothetical protein